MFILVFLFKTSSLCWAAPNSHNEKKTYSYLSSFLDTHDSITLEMKEKAIDKFISFNQSFNIHPTSESKTLRRLFFSVQETFLKEYSLYSSFYHTLESGKYDCLTASVLYAIFLEDIKQRGDFDYVYQIVQMPTHVFIKITLSDKSEIIFESTDSKKGFIATPKAIDFYVKDQIEIASKQREQESVLKLDNTVFNNLLTLEQVSPLLYFNQGVLFFNQRKFGKSIQMAQNALFLEKNKTYYLLIQLSLQEMKKECEINNSFVKTNFKYTQISK
ncbi:hypothetical protein [Bernardetia sp.]|uniref:hypothetical protein n=1 Tax=Bernardetia sp. TaxID=1937974 RepID=UPI0025BD5EBD|nr:hypothetical protein [Bernardetia sp.]